MNQFDLEVEVLRKLVDDYSPSIFGEDELERKAASEFLTSKYDVLYEELGKRIQKADCECREARDGLPDDASNAEIDAAAYKDSLVVFEIYGEVDEKLSAIIIELERKDKEFLEMKNPPIKTEDDLSTSNVETCISDTEAPEVEDPILPFFIYQPDRLDTTTNEMNLIDEYEEDPPLSGTFDTLASLLLSQLLNPGSAGDDSVNSIFQHEYTALESELANMLASLHRSRFGCGCPGASSRHERDDSVYAWAYHPTSSNGVIKWNPNYHYQPDGLDQTANKTKLIDESEEDSPLPGSFDTLNSLLLSQLLNLGSAGFKSARLNFQHEYTALESELAKMFASLHRSHFRYGPPGVCVGASRPTSSNEIIKWSPCVNNPASCRASSSLGEVTMAVLFNPLANGIASLCSSFRSATAGWKWSEDRAVPSSPYAFARFEALSLGIVLSFVLLSTFIPSSIVLPLALLSSIVLLWMTGGQAVFHDCTRTWTKKKPSQSLVRMCVGVLLASQNTVAASNTGLRPRGLGFNNRTLAQGGMQTPMLRSGLKSKSRMDHWDKQYLETPEQRVRSLGLFTLQQNENCPTFDVAVDSLLDIVDPAGIGSIFKNWLETDGIANNFVDEMISLYANEQFIGVTGADLKGEDAGVCPRLPLKDDECYFALNPNANFLQALVAKYVPFGEHIVNVIEKIEEIQETIDDTIEDVRNFFLPEAEDEGTCFVANENMIGIVDVPGVVPPFLYEFCNCITLKTKPHVPACPVQPYFRGFAFGLANNALEYDVSERLGNDFKFFDGYAESTFTPEGDIWARLDIEIGVSKLFGFATKYVCLPSKAPDGKKAKIPKIPKLSLKTSLLVQNDITATTDGELVILLAIEEIVWTYKMFLEVSIGTALATLRVRSAEPDCAPSGLFFSADVDPEIESGDILQPFLDLYDPTDQFGNRMVDWGVTWNDRGEPDADDFLQSLFFKLDIEDINFFNLNVDRATIEVQYFDDKEFERRRDFEANCAAYFNNDYEIPNSQLEAFINDDEDLGIEALPTIALFVDVKEAEFGFGGIITLQELKIEAIVQVGNDASISIFLGCKVQALYIVDIVARVKFLDTPTRTDAELFVSREVNVGLGKLLVSLEATASVGEFKNPSTRRRRRELDVLDGNNELLDSNNEQALATGNLLNADWDITFICDWQTAEWRVNLGKAIVEGLKIIGQAIAFVWNEITKFVGEAWTAIKDLAVLIGGTIADVFEKMGELVDNAQGTIADGVDAAAKFLSGQGLGAEGNIAIATIQFFGDAAIFVFDKVGDVLDLGAAIFSGDWAGVGEAAANLFGFSKSVSGKTEVDLGRVDDILGCPLKRLKWKECKRALGVKYNCRSKESQDYPEKTCAEEKAAQIEKLKEDAELADAQEKCKQASQDRNQGLQYVNERNATDLREDLNASMDRTELNLGKINSTLSFSKLLPFTVKVQTLASDSKGLAGEGSTSGRSANSIDFSDKDVLGSALLNFQQNDLKTAAADLSRGDQGLDKDSTVKDCGKVAGLECDDPPYFDYPNNDYQLSATITCDVDPSFKYSDVFGVSTLVTDDACPATIRPTRFSVVNTMDDPDDGCDPVRMEIRRSATDCCDQPVVQTHFITIESLPPVFNQTPGSLDATKKCDANIHPKITGEPTFQPGCKDAFIDVDAEDESLFDVSTCETTVTRTWTAIQDNCTTLSDTFVQTIILENDYDPKWDFFPDDETIGLFEDYGTEALGFPTAYQQCGASPIAVTYTDEIVEGECYAEKILTRTFKAVDICGHTITRNQTITITNNANDLPLGEKSLASIYGRNRARIQNEDNICLWGSIGNSDCGIYGAPTRYQCGSAEEDEFSAYQSFLGSLSDKSLDIGPTEKSCSCTEADASCDVGQVAKDGGTYYVDVIYGVQVVDAAAADDCEVDSSMAVGSNTGTSSEEEYSCPNFNVGSSSENCTQLNLEGTNDVYNFFSIEAEDLEQKKIVVDAPLTSIVLVNVMSDPGQNVKVQNIAEGVELVGVPPSDVLWNMGDGLNFYLTPTARTPYSWYGTIINNGLMDLTLSKQAQNTWQGQMFVDELNANVVVFECGAHFAGFVTCEQTKEPESICTSKPKNKCKKSKFCDWVDNACIDRELV